MKAVHDVFPTNQNGEVIYSETNFPRLGALGAPVTQANVTSALNTVSAATAALPNKPVTYQSDFSKTANTIGTIAAVVAVVPGIGWVAAAVCGVVAGVCALLGKLFANSKAKAYAAERKEYEKVNSQIRYENEQLDFHYETTVRAVNNLKVTFKELSGLNGLGLCIIGCKKKEEKAKLLSAKEEFEVLSKQQEAKTTALMLLVDEFNKLMKGKFDVTQIKSTNLWLFWILGGSVLIIGGYYAYRNRTKIKKELSK